MRVTSKTVEIPKQVNEVMNSYQKLFEQELPDCLFALYLVGSIALGAYVENVSDIDFVAIINKKLNASEWGQIEKVHKKITGDFPGIDLEGSYLTLDQVGKSSQDIGEFPYFGDGKLKYGKGSGNACIVTWFILRKHGITIFGPQPANLDFSVDERLLLQYLHDNVNTYWKKRVESLKSRGSVSRITGMFSKETEWGVLGIARLYYTLIEKDITSKVHAGEYLVGKIPEKYETIVYEAIRVRKNEDVRYYHSPWKRRKDLISFMEFMIRACNAIYERDALI
jgi:hypothetical protein